MSNVKKMTIGEVLKVHRKITNLQIASQHPSCIAEPFNRNQLASAIFRQRTGFGNVFKYNAAAEIGATLFYGIVMGHAFKNGNKRTALGSLLASLGKNNTFLVNAGEEDLYELARRVATHEIEIEPLSKRNADAEVCAVANWLREHTRERVHAEL